MSELERLIRDMVEKGELTHLSLSPYEKNWAVSYCAASPVGGYTFIIDKDPVNAIVRAIEETKLKKRHKVTAAVKADDA